MHRETHLSEQWYNITSGNIYSNIARCPLQLTFFLFLLEHKNNNVYRSLLGVVASIGVSTTMLKSDGEIN